MEDTLRDYGKEECYREFDCLNPCFNGRYSQRVSELSNNACSRVLILVLMEDTLRVMNDGRKFDSEGVAS